MFVKIKFLLITILFLFTLNLWSLELGNKLTTEDITFAEDYKLSNILLNDLNVRIYQTGIDCGQLNFFKEQLEMEKSLFDKYLKASKQEIRLFELKLADFENKQANSTIENTRQAVVLYSEQYKIVQKYKVRIHKIENIRKSIDDLLSEINNRHVQIDDRIADKKYANDYELTVKLVEDLNARITQSGLGKKQLDFFKSQLLMLKKLFEIHLLENRHKIKFWNMKLADYEREQSGSSLNVLQKGLNLYNERSLHLEKYNNVTFQINNILNKINKLLYRIVNRRVKVSDRLLFASEGRFYKSKTWSLAIDDISRQVKTLVFDIQHTTLKNINMPGAKLWLLILVLYFICLKWISRLVVKLTNGILLNKLDAKMDLTHIYQVIRILLFGVIPGHIIYLVVTSLSLATVKYDSIVLAVLFTFACSISFCLLIYASLTAFVKNINKTKFFNIIFFCFVVFMILMNNNINAFSFSTQFYPFVGLYGVAFINLIVSIALTVWGLIMLSKLQRYLISIDTFNVYTKIGMISLLVVAVMTPIIIFLGYSNLVIGFLVNCLQTVMIFYYLYLIYKICYSFISIIAANVYAFYLKKNEDNGIVVNQQVIHPYIIQQRSSFQHVMYWVRIVLATVISIAAVVLTLLSWGVPPVVVDKFFEFVLFHPFPIGENPTFSLYRLFHAFIVLLIGVCITILISTMAGRQMHKHTNAAVGSKYAIKMILRYVGFAISFAIFIFALGVDSKSMTFIISGLSIGVGFALKDTLSNFFAGIIILVGRQIRAGDWVYSTDLSIEGNVQHIGLHSTRILSFEHRPIIVPNAILNSESIVNATRMSHRRIKQFIGVRYKDINVVDKILNSIKEMLLAHPAIDQNCAILVNLVDGNTDMGSSVEGCFGSYSINFMVYAYTKTTHWIKFQKVQDEIMLKIGSIIIDYGAEITFPSSNVALSMVDPKKDSPAI